MTTFKISKEGVKRLNELVSYIKTFSQVAGLDEKQLFFLDPATSKLEIYASGPQSFLTCRIDLTDVVVDPTFNEDVFFTSPSSSFVTSCDKIEGDEVSIVADHKRANKLTFKGQGRSTVSLSPKVNSTPKEIKELRSRLDEEAASNDYKNGIVLNLTEDFKKNFASMVAVSKVLGRTGDVEVSSKTLRAANELCIATFAAPTNLTKTVYVQSNLIELLKNSNEIRLYGDDARKAAFEVPNKGFSALIEFGASTYEFPTDAELSGFLPEASDEVEIEVGTDDLKSALKAFDGLFDASTWRFKQVRIGYNRKDFLKTKELSVSYDDLKAECQQFLRAELVSDTSSLPSFQFTIATLHLTGALHDFISSSDKVRIKFNGLRAASPHGSGVNLRTSELDATIPKMVE
jgi:hypothetical protein